MTQQIEEWVPDQRNLITFVLADDAAVEIPGLGSSWTIEISTAGAAVWLPGQGTKSEIGNGWYAYLTTESEASSSQPGPRSVRITHASIAQQNLEYTVLARDTGSVDVSFFVANSADGQPIPGATVWFTVSEADKEAAIWQGVTDFTGAAKDQAGNDPRLGIGVLYAWKYLSGWTDDRNPHQIDTSALQTFVSTMTEVPALPDLTAPPEAPTKPAYLWANPDQFQKYWFWDFGDAALYEQLWPLLRLASSRVTAALNSSDQLTCPRDEWGDEYLRELTIIIAGIMFNTPAVRLSNEQRQLYQLYVTEQLTLLRQGEVTICSGETARGYPAYEIARYGLTERNAARILAEERALS